MKRVGGDKALSLRNHIKHETNGIEEACTISPRPCKNICIPAISRIFEWIELEFNMLNIDKYYQV